MFDARCRAMARLITLRRDLVASRLRFGGGSKTRFDVLRGCSEPMKRALWIVNNEHWAMKNAR
eukprot:4364675-Lingulodinium_polyedra.AAC.1